MKSNQDMVNSIEDRWLEPKDDPVICSWCGRKIKEDEKYYQIGMDNVCTDCIEECAYYA